jgi:hypothetical protein
LNGKDELMIVLMHRERRMGYIRGGFAVMVFRMYEYTEAGSDHCSNISSSVAGIENSQPLRIDVTRFPIPGKPSGNTPFGKYY